MIKPTKAVVTISELMQQLAQKENTAQKELSIARTIQAAMVPTQLPAIDGIECTSIYLPSRQVGGDLFDIVQLTDDIIAVSIFDVASNGISAALISALAKVFFANTIRSTLSPRLVVERVNAEMTRHIESGFFMTAAVAYLDLHDNRLTYCNAGHPYPILYRRNTGTIESLRSTGTFLGHSQSGSFFETSLYLNSGDWLLFFTDGIYQLFSQENELAGRRKLEQTIVSTLLHGSPLTFLSKVNEAYDSITNHDIPDDVTIVGIEFLSQSRKDQIKVKLGFAENDPVYMQFIRYFEEMDKTAAVILSAMDNFGYADDSIRKMKIILTELFANAIYHGNNADHTKKVIIGHVIDRSKITISIMDEGEGFDLSKIPDPTLPENIGKDCGRGLYIVNNYTDSMSFNEKGNRITITKNYVAS